MISTPQLDHRTCRLRGALIVIREMITRGGFATSHSAIYQCILCVSCYAPCIGKPLKPSLDEERSWIQAGPTSVGIGAGGATRVAALRLGGSVMSTPFATR
jgi:hypothetical protein